MTRQTRSTTTRPIKTKASDKAGGSDSLDNGFLETLVGYNTRRAWSQISAVFSERMAPYGLKQVDFSVLSLLTHNPGATSRQLCATLDILPPNLVNLIAALDSRGLIERRPHPRDGRAVGLYLTAAGEKLTRETEQAVVQLELDASAKLNARERETLIRLLQKLYL
ncbi:MarR family winged helix-turn-helix transcriptional regulator [Variovorax sp. OV329]|uniref:MarR family winged helix-turn-helix transcriptional regulator n=1 Tax=Variovorax sp. OV329 TaxID=1882825 RepID=UPI0008E850D5|nr:MarR family winged helix-turn-helix transcriptional regulator [Variovorax sp. OV329]SFM75892.1 DNA-binding transcriptional regulator, MarR family [Variovorax sp. OV329]